VELVSLPRVVFVGEALLELSRRDRAWHLGYGGDTLNTAIHLARQGYETAYLTAIGSDPLSAELEEGWRAEGLSTELVLTHPTRATGLYAITTDDEGERSFTYWREASAARAMFALPGIEEALARARAADLLGFSLISLAVLDDEARDRLLSLAREVRSRGGKVAFDGNYRARLWNSPEEARVWRDRGVACAHFGFPTLDDELALGAPDAAAVAAHWQALGCGETVVKLGADGCRLPDGREVKPERVLEPIDTTGAGDAFDAGYLGARLGGASPLDAARAGHARAAWTIMRAGGIPAQEALSPRQVD
jgi:2-dehydro-3-deoxygluconokinase